MSLERKNFMHRNAFFRWVAGLIVKMRREEIRGLLKRSSDAAQARRDMRSS